MSLFEVTTLKDVQVVIYQYLDAKAFCSLMQTCKFLKKEMSLIFNVSKTKFAEKTFKISNARCNIRDWIINYPFVELFIIDFNEQVISEDFFLLLSINGQINESCTYLIYKKAKIHMKELEFCTHFSKNMITLLNAYNTCEENRKDKQIQVNTDVDKNIETSYFLPNLEELSIESNFFFPILGAFISNSKLKRLTISNNLIPDDIFLKMNLNWNIFFPNVTELTLFYFATKCIAMFLKTENKGLSELFPTLEKLKISQAEIYQFEQILEFTSNDVQPLENLMQIFKCEFKRLKTLHLYLYDYFEGENAIEKLDSIFTKVKNVKNVDIIIQREMFFKLLSIPLLNLSKLKLDVLALKVCGISQRYDTFLFILENTIPSELRKLSLSLDYFSVGHNFNLRFLKEKKLLESIYIRTAIIDFSGFNFISESVKEITFYFDLNITTVLSSKLTFWVKLFESWRFDLPLPNISSFNFNLHFHNRVETNDLTLSNHKTHALTFVNAIVEIFQKLNNFYYPKKFQVTPSFEMFDY